MGVSDFMNSIMQKSRSGIRSIYEQVGKDNKRMRRPFKFFRLHLHPPELGEIEKHDNDRKVKIVVRLLANVRFGIINH